jgi:hypothetical protein
MVAVPGAVYAPEVVWALLAPAVPPGSMLDDPLPVEPMLEAPVLDDPIPDEPMLDEPEPYEPVRDESMPLQAASAATHARERIRFFMKTSFD